MLKLFNTLSRKTEDFQPLADKKVGLYSCGPTVYNYAHIGNLSAYIFVDLLKRYLRYRGYAVKHVMNLTDVDDKTIRGAKQAGESLHDFTEKYAQAFFADLQALNIDPADVYPKATEHIPEMVALVQKLLEKGVAYEKDGSVYFKIAAFPKYGKLAQLDKQSLRSGASGVTADEYSKENANDFVLWKAYKPEEDGEVFWETALGKGRPGWHIECSAMSQKYLGETFDIHTGGVDLVFPHHDNEIAQSEAATGKPFVKYWLHREFLNIDAQKMSKSLGNIKTLKDIAKDQLDAAAFRYFIVAAHYRTPLNFTQGALDYAKNTLLNLRRFAQALTLVENPGDDQVEKIIADAREKFIAAMDDDLNTPVALSHIFNLITQVEKMLADGTLNKASAQAVLKFLQEIDQVLGVIFFGFTAEKEKLPAEIKKLLSEREAARKNKDWDKSDELRKEIEAQGYVLEDTTAGQVAKKKL